jgi:hypothetical protein
MKYLLLIAATVTTFARDSSEVFFNRPKAAWDGQFVRATSAQDIQVVRRDRGRTERVIVRVAGVPPVALSPSALARLNAQLKMEIGGWNLVIVPERSGASRIGYRLQTTFEGSSKPHQTAREVSVAIRRLLKAPKT